MFGSSHRIVRISALAAWLALAIGLASPQTVFASYPAPVLGDTYGVEQAIEAVPQAGCDMAIEGFTLDQNGYLWTVENDWLNGSVGTSRLVKRTAAGAPIAIYGQGFGANDLWWGTSASVDPATGHLYVGDGYHSRVSIFDPNTGEFLGQLGDYMAADPLYAITDQPYGLSYPADVVFDGSGNIFVSDENNHRVIKYDQAHQFVTAWGVVNGTTGTEGFYYPAGMDLDESGNLWIADMGNNRVQKYSSSGTYLDTLRPQLDGGDRFSSPVDVFVDVWNTVYVVDRPSSAPWQGGRFSRWGAQKDFLGEYGTATPTGYLDRPTSVQVDDFGTAWLTDKVADGTSGLLEAWALNAGDPDLTPPTTTSNIPAGWTKGPFSVTLQSTDASSPVIATYFSTDGSTPTTAYAGPFSVSAEGTTTVKFYSVDRPGNEETVKSRLLKIDNGVPSTSASVETTYFGTAAITFTAADTLSGVRDTWWTVDGGLPNNQPTALVSTQGFHTLTYWSEDNAGNREPYKYATFSVMPPDETPPDTYWAESRPDWFRANTTVTLVATDTVSGVQTTYYRLNGSEPTTYTGSFVWSQEGTTTLTYWSVDRLGHVEPAHVESIRLDKGKPSSVAHVPEGAIGSATVTFEASDTVSGIATLEWRLDTDANWTTGNSATINTFGNFTLWHRAIDKAGNAEDPKAVSITILQPDNDPPITGTNIPLSGWVRGPFNLQFDPFDNISGVAMTLYSVDGAPFDIWFPDEVFVTDGVHSVQWYSIDNRDNVETVRSRTLKVDSQPPVTTDDHQPTYAGPATIHLTANDTLSPTQTYYRIDGSVAQMGTSISLSDYRTYNIEYWSEDDAGNAETPHTFTVTVNAPDVVPPVTSFTGPAGWQRGSAQFSLSAWDASSTVKSTMYSTDGVSFTPYYSPVTISADGTTTVHFYSVDFFNNREDTKTGYLRVDNSAPLTTSDAVANYTEQAVVTLTPSDSSSGVDRTYYRIDGGTWQQGTVATVVWSSKRRTRTLDWYSVDKVGNTESVKSATFDVRLVSKIEQEDNSNIVYRGAWDFSGDPYLARTSDGGAFALVSFQGTRLDMYARKSGTYGLVRYTLLNTGASAIVDLYESSGSYGNLTWTTGDLDFGDYLVKVEYLGDKNPLSTNDRINIDYVRVEGSLTQVPDTQAPVTTHNAPTSWVEGPVPVTLTSVDTTTGVGAIYATSNGTTPTAGDVYLSPIIVSAEGVTTLKFYAVDNRGNAEAMNTTTVRVDNTAPVTNTNAISSYTTTASVALLPTDPYSGVAYTKWRLDGSAWTTGTAVTVPKTSIGSHLLEWYSVDNIGHVESIKSTTFTIYNRFDQNDTAIVYRSSWSLQSGASHYQSAYRYATAAGAEVYVRIQGTGFSLVAPKGGDFGIASLSIDGGAPVDVDLYAATSASQQRVFTASGLSNGTHRIKIAWTGRKNGSSSGTKVAIDALDVVGTLSADGIAPSTSDNADPTWRNTSASVSLSANDTDTWVAATYYRLNGGAQMTYATPLAITAEGTNTVQYWSVDGAGNIEQVRSCIVRIDYTKPTASAAAPAQWSQGPVVVQLSGADSHSGVASIRYSTDGSFPSDVAVDGKVTVSAEGTTTVKYAALDTAGNTGDVQQVDVRVDDTDPNTSSDIAAGWSTADRIVTLSAVDSLSGVAQTFYRVNGGDAQVYEAPFVVSAEGTSTIEYWSIDAAGNVEAATAETVSVDKTSPVTVDDAPTSWTSGPVLVTLAPVDAVSGVSATLYSLDGSDPTVPYAGPVLIASQGATTLRFRSVDVAGNSEEISTRIVLIDDVAPVTTDDAPSAWVHGPVGVHLNATDAVSGVGTTQYRLGDAGWTTYDSSITVSAEGTTTLSYRSTDIKGNVEAARAVDVRIDNTAPVTTSNAAASYTGNAVVALAASDALSGVGTTVYRVDGGDWMTGTVATVSEGGPHLLEWRSSDVVGNTEEIQSATFSVTKRFEQDAAGTYFRGTWGSVNHSGLSGGSFKSTTWAGAAVRLTFDGTGINWITSRNGNYGIARLTLDGVTQDVDLYGPFAFKQTVWSSGLLADGTHTLLIEYTGNKNASSSGTAIGVDAFDITGEIVGDTVSPTTSASAASGWQRSNVPVTLTASDTDSFVSATYYRVNGGATTAYSGTFAITGEGTSTVEYWSVDSAGNNEAPHSLNVLIDKTAPASWSDAPITWQPGPVTIHLDASDTLSGTKRILFSIDGSEPSIEATQNTVRVSAEGTTTVRFRAEDQAGNLESVRTATVLIDSVTPSTSDNVPTGWVEGPIWVSVTATDSASGIAGIYATTDGTLPDSSDIYTSPILVASEGVTYLKYYAVDVRGNASPVKVATIRVDNSSPNTTSNAISSYTTTATIALSPIDPHAGVASTHWRLDGGAWQAGTGITVPSSALGNHTLDWYSTDAIGHVEATKTVAFTVLRRFEETDASINLRGTWSTVTNGGLSGGSFKTATVGSAINVTFTGTRVDWVTSRNSSYGIAQVTLDDNAPVLVDLYGPFAFKQRVWSSGDLANGTHTLRIDYTGTKNAASTGYAIGIDAIDVVGDLVGDAVAPRTSDDTNGQWHTSAQAVTLSATDDETWVDTTFYRVGGGTWTPYVEPIAISSPGVTTLEYYSVDAAGNIESLHTATVKIDGAAPITDDDAPTTWVAEPVVVHLSATDSHSGVDRILYSTDGSQPSLLATGGAVPVSVEGTTVVRYSSVDVAGNTETPKECVVRIDSSAPQSADDAPAGWNEGPVVVTLSSVDSLSGVSALRYSINGSAFVAYSQPLTITDDGVTTIDYVAVDAVGNTETTKTATVMIDATSPSTTDNVPATWSTAPVLATLNAIDEHSGIAATYYSIDGSYPTLPYTGPVLVAQSGVTNLKYYSVDLKGNSETVIERTVLVDTVAPQTTDNAPSAWVNGPVSVQLASTDEHSGIAHVLYSLDGTFPSIVSEDGSVTIAAEGATTLTYAGRDVAGNTESPRSATIRIDNTAPVTSSNVKASYAGTATVTLAPVDAYSGVTATQWRLDGGTWHDGTVVVTSAGGPHTLEWRSIDAAGNVEQIRSAAFDLVKRMEQDTSSVYFGGTWSNVSNGALSGGSFKSTTWAGAAVRLSFSGTGIDWITSRNTSYGRARLTLDGVAQDVDLYGALAFKQKVWSSGALANGVHTLMIEYTGTKNASSTGTAIGVDAFDITGEPIADAAAPNTSSSAASGWQRANVPVTLTGSDANSFVALTSYRVNGGAATLYSGPFSVTAEGTTTIDYWSVDSAGNAETPKSLTVLVDKTSPAASNDAPVAWVKGTAVVHVTATDAHSGVGSILYSLDGSEPTGPYSGSINVTAEGVTTVKYKVVDVAGNSSSGTTVARIDNTAPSTTNSAPASWANANVALQLTATDAASGVRSVRASVDGAAATTYTAPLNIVTEGEHTITYAAADMAGNVESTRTVQVKIDKTAPTTTSSLQSSYTATGTVSLSGTDALSGVSSVKWRIDGGAWNTGTTATLPYIGGVHTLEWSATDAAGNAETPKSGTYNMTKRFEQTDAFMTYGGTWSTVNHASLSGGSFKTTYTPGSSLDFTFKGTQIDLITSRNTSYGKARITLDGGAPQEVDLYGAFAFKQRVWSSGTLTNSTHSIKIEYAGTKNASSTGYTIGVDAFDITGEPSERRYEQSDSLINLEGTWSTVTNGGLSGGSFVSASSAGSAVNVAFSGTRIDWFTSRNTSYGKARLVVDGGSAQEVDLYGSFGFQQKVWSSGDLADGNHTLRIEYTGSKNASSSAYSIGVDAFDVRGILKQATAPAPPYNVLEETSNLIAYDGTWSSTTNSGLSGGSFKQTLSPGSAANIAFTGTRIDWVTSKNSTYGKARVSVDGAAAVDVDLYGTFAFRQVVWSSGNLSSGPHTVRIEYTGTKNAAASGTAIGIDAMNVYGSATQATSPIPPGTRYEETSSLLAFEGSWTTGSHSDFSGGSQKTASSAGSACNVRFNGTRFDWIGARNSNYGKALVSVDGQTPVEVDLYGSYGLKQVVWTSGPLAQGDHTVRIEALGAHSSSSTGNYISIDAVDVLGTLLQAQSSGPAKTRYEQDVAGLTYASTWNTTSHSSLSAGSYKSTTSSSATVQLTFTGTSIDWITSKNTNFGIAQVSLDGGAPVDVDLYGSIAFKQMVWTSGALTDGTHTLRISYTGRSNPSSTGTAIGVDAFDIAGAIQ